VAGAVRWPVPLAEFRLLAERTFSTAKDPASNNIARRWTRLMGLAPLTLWLACLLVVRNQRILDAWAARQDDNARRAAAGLPPRTRTREVTLDPGASTATPVRNQGPAGSLPGPDAAIPDTLRTVTGKSRAQCTPSDRAGRR
jgi:hypothetical protein